MLSRRLGVAVQQVILLGPPALSGGLGRLDSSRGDHFELDKADNLVTNCYCLSKWSLQI